MAKDAYYFSHDSNAKDDPKCVMLIEQLGPEGYGVFWILVEMLRDQPGYRYPLTLIPAIARRYNTTFEKVKTVIYNYGLFEVDEREFFSLSLIRRMDHLEESRLRKSIAGKKGNEIRWQIAEQSQCDNDAMAMGSQIIASKVKESKEKETKLKEIKLYTPDETEVLSTWNSKGIINHNESEHLKKEIAKALKKPGKEKVILAITQYSILLHDTEFYYSNKFTLANFLKQGNGLPNFLDDGQIWMNYLSREKRNIGKLQPNKPVQQTVTEQWLAMREAAGANEPN